jgi:hypothetical protein
MVGDYLLTSMLTGTRQYNDLYHIDHLEQEQTVYLVLQAEQQMRLFLELLLQVPVGQQEPHWYIEYYKVLESSD